MAASNTNVPPTPQGVMNLLPKLDDQDPDFRYMSLNDLQSLLQRAKPDFLLHEYNVAARATDKIIKTLDDQNGEVQNLAVKTLGPFVAKVPSSIIAPMLDKLGSLKLKNSVDPAIPSLALREVIIALPRPTPGVSVTPPVQEAYGAISRVLIPRLIGPGPNTRVPQTSALTLPAVPTGLLQTAGELTAETIDVLIEVVKCFGPLLQSLEVEAMSEVVLHILKDPTSTSPVKKRAVAAISMLATYLDNAQLDAVVKRILSNLAQSAASPVTRRLYISIIGSMARSTPVRFGTHISEAVPLVLTALSDEELQSHMAMIEDGDDPGQDFNEVRESALVALEAFLASCPLDMQPFTKDVITCSLRYLKYDPNFASDEEEDDMDVDDDADELDEDDEYEDDDGFEDDDDDASWKVRRCSAKVIYTLIATRASGDLLENGVLYGEAAPSLIKRVSEREENVRLEVLAALSLLVRKTGEGMKLPELSLDDPEPEPATHIPISRKRRRQSSVGSGMANHLVAGLSSPVMEKVPASGPRADLARLTPSIIKAVAKQLKGKTVPTKQSVVNLLGDIISAQKGGLTDFLGEVIGPVVDAIKPSGATTTSAHLATGGGAASATPGTLRVAALKLMSNLTRTHSSAVLQPFFTKIVAGVSSAAVDRFYKISGEALQTAEELIKAITPPRSRGAGTKYAAELDKLYSVLIDRGSANDSDAEVRQRALHAIGVLVARTSSPDGAALLLSDKRKAALEILRERLKNETTRLAAVRAIDNVAIFAQSVDQLEGPWIQDVALELAAQLRKANRSLRGSSIVALKHLILSKAAAGQLAPDTIQGVVSELMPAVTNSDTHLLGPALLILAHLVPDNAELIVTQGMIDAICQLLKSHFASIILDQLLLLVANIGGTPASAPLMQGLLKDVSVQGDPVVTGKVIGTLLVTGKSSGVTLESFIQELQTSTKNNDSSRVSLALAVLGEAGMRLGSDSPLKPDLFLSQFHDEPDKVSLSAAIALGRAGSSNVPEYLGVILREMKKGGHRQYLLIQSVKEILQSIPVQSEDMRSQAQPIWDQLLLAAVDADNKVVCAECVGRLVILDAQTFMPKLQTLLKDQSVSIRAMAVQAVRYTLPEWDDAFDLILKTNLIDMLLVMLQDSDTEIRRLAMTTLNSAAHNKPDLIRPHLGRLMPYVLEESVIKPELIKEVMLGPFKHTVDDGLEVRKSAYETLYSLMDIAFPQLSTHPFFDRIIAGLKDDNDIRSLCNLMVTKLVTLDPDETSRRLDLIAEAYRTVLSHKLKDNAVKQDVEKQEETNKSILRVTLLLGDKMKDLTGNAGAATSNVAGIGIGVWTQYWDWVVKEFAGQLKGLKEESQMMQGRMV